MSDIKAATKTERKKCFGQILISSEELIQQEVPENRREEIREYLELFGYMPEHTILQVHDAGSFGRGILPQRLVAARERTAARYGGRTFTVV